MERKINYFILLSTGAIGLFAVIQWKTNASIYDTGRKAKDNYYSSVKTCEARRKIGFLKMHKCASMTLQNIFLRKRPGCRLYTIGGYTFMDSVKLDQWKKADTAALKSLTKKCNSLK
ncbi:uncharacterized protein LOC136028396 isoform X2 [Artemia franciscana]|uniref:uncharacterized protein LOC136028396 isoform X2 n=1 Tax=Artemia franciscana TaxID=6661 RepID=UPI0032DA7805